MNESQTKTSFGADKVSVREHYFWSMPPDMQHCASLVEPYPSPRRCGRTAEEHEIKTVEESNRFNRLRNGSLSERITYAIRLFGATRIEAHKWACGDSCYCEQWHLKAVCPPGSSGLPMGADREWFFDLWAGDFQSEPDRHERGEALQQLRSALKQARADGRLPVRFDA